MCDIQITNVNGNNPNLTSITVIGTVDACRSDIEGKRLVVKISCPPEVIAFAGDIDLLQGNFIEASNIFIGDDGVWFATFNNISSCRCGGQITVTAHCASNVNCKATLTVDDMECVSCPEITNLSESGDDVVVNPVPECNPDGTATVTITKFVINNTPNPVLIKIHPGHPEAIVVSGGTQAFNPGVSGPVSITVTYPTLSSPQPYAVIHKVNDEQMGCPPVKIDIDPMPSCCPDIEIDKVTVDDCFIVVKVNPSSIPLGCTYIWDFDADNPDSVQEFGTVGQRNHTYDQTGTYKIVVRVQCGSCLNSAETSITISKCDSGKESTGCGVLRLIVAVSAALTILTGLLALCVPAAAFGLAIAAAVFAITGIIVGLVYSFFCPNKPCYTALLISAQATLGAGVGAIILSNCCPWIIWAGLALVVSGLGLFAIWQSKCNQSTCFVTKEIVKVIGGVVLPVLGIVVAIPLLNACFNFTALGIISALFGGIAAYAVSCNS